MARGSKGASDNLTGQLGEAIAYARKGWRVFPCGRDKKPLTPNGFKDAATDPDQIKTWWTRWPDASIGCPTGPDMGKGAWVLDVDLPEGPATLAALESEHGALPATVEQRTGSGGRQLFFRWPEGRDVPSRAGKIGKKLDTRGRGGYVIVPPSGHPSGGRYTWTSNRTPLADAPAWLLDLVDPLPKADAPRPQPQTSTHHAGTTPYGKAALDDEAQKVAGADHGGRNHILNQAAFAAGQLVAGGEIDQTEAESALMDAAMTCGLTEGEARKTMASGMSAGMKEPRSAPVVDVPGVTIIFPTPTPRAVAPVCPPEPLRRALPTPDPFPMAALGDVLAPAAQAIAEVTKAPDATCGQSVLAAAALAVQGHADVEIDGRVCPLSENFVTVGESGGRKSAVDQVALWPHRKHERELAGKYGEEIEDYKIKLAAHKKSREMILAKGKTYEERQVGLRALEPEPDAPLSPILITEDPTIEGLVKLLAIGQPSMGLFSDEGGRLIGGYGMSPENQLKTAAGLSGLWDGKPIDRVRGMDGASKIYGRRVSIHIMVQPNVASLFLGNEMLAGQGLLARCLTAFPESTAGTRTYNPVDISQHPALRQYNARMLDILETPLPLAEGKRNELDPPRLRLAADAKGLWVRFHDFVEIGLGGDGEFAPVRAFASKTAEHAARLAGILTLVDDIHARGIPLDKMASGIELAKHYLAEALRLYHAGATDPDIGLAERLLGWLKAQGRQHIWMTLIYQLGPSAIRDAKTAKRIIRILEDHHWLEAIDGGMEIDGQFRRDVWRLKA
jgi:hypothetical protein